MESVAIPAMEAELKKAEVAAEAKAVAAKVAAEAQLEADGLVPPMPPAATAKVQALELPPLTERTKAEKALLRATMPNAEEAGVVSRPQTKEGLNKQFGSFGKMVQARSKNVLNEQLNKRKENKKYMESVVIPHMEAEVKKAEVAAEAKAVDDKVAAEAKLEADGLVPPMPPAATAKVAVLELPP